MINITVGSGTLKQTKFQSLADLYRHLGDLVNPVQLCLADETTLSPDVISRIKTAAQDESDIIDFRG